MRALSVALLALAGCPGVECQDLPPEVTLGTAAPEFVALKDGDFVELVHGPQGGWHLLLAARAEHTTSDVILRLTVDETANDVPVSELTYEVALFPDGECAGVYAGIVAIVDVSELDADATAAEALSGRELWIRLEIEDDRGRTAVDDVLVLAG